MQTAHDPAGAALTIIRAAGPTRDTTMTTPQHLSDRYELGDILGFGGMSEVHLARDVRLHRDVAVKVLRADLARDPSFYLRFRREAQNAAALNHPAIVAVYDTGEADTAAGPLPYIVMEYVDGVTLRDIVHTDGPMPAHRAIEIIADACQALNFSHQHGIIHRDVKPANIMISTHQRGEGDGLRHRAGDRRQRQQRHPDRRGNRDRAISFARAGPRRHRRCPLRRLLTGLRALRNAHWRAAFHRGLAGCGRLPTCPRRPGAAVAARTRASPRNSTPSCSRRWPRTPRTGIRPPRRCAPTWSGCTTVRLRKRPRCSPMPSARR